MKVSRPSARRSAASRRNLKKAQFVKASRKGSMKYNKGR